MKQVKIINYFYGNIFSVAKAFEYFGCNVTIGNCPDEFKDADYIVLPGVGAFGEGIRRLQEQNLIMPALDFIKKGKPFLGICLGMQLLFTCSEEFGVHKGLNIIPGTVKRLIEQPGTKIPNIGWNSIDIPEGRDHAFWGDSILRGISPGKDMYFVHSYAPYPEKDKYWLSRTPYGSDWFCSSTRKDNVYGCQFHPEKSGKTGLKIIENFLKL